MLDTISSGVTACDATTYADALGIIEKYGLRKSMPQSVMQTLTLGVGGKIPETMKSGDPAAASVNGGVISGHRGGEISGHLC